MNIYVEVLLRTLLSITVMIVLARINGSKQIAQLSFYDYVVGITAGSIAAVLCIDTSIDIGVCLIGMVLFMLSSIVISLITNHSIFMRRLFTGSPNVLIKDGEIMFEQLKRARFDVNDLLRELRCQGYFDITTINCAVLETNGKVSVLLKSTDRPLTASEQGVNVEQDTVPSNVIIDGKIIEGNLSATGHDKKWLNDQLLDQNVLCYDDIALATVNDNDLSVFIKNQDKKKRTIFQ